MEPMRRKRLDERLKKMMLTSTSNASPRFCNDPKVPPSTADWPPPQEVMPALIRHIPMSETTMPDTSGVMILRV